MEVQEEDTNTCQCPQINEHIQCSHYGPMHSSSIPTPIVFQSLLLFVTNMFNALMHLKIYEWHDVMVLKLDPQPLWSPLHVMGWLCKWEGTSIFSFFENKTQKISIHYFIVACWMILNWTNTEQMVNLHTLPRFSWNLFG